MLGKQDIFNEESFQPPTPSQVWDHTCWNLKNLWESQDWPLHVSFVFALYTCLRNHASVCIFVNMLNQIQFRK